MKNIAESPLSKTLLKSNKAIERLLEYTRTEEGETYRFKKLGIYGFYSVAKGKYAIELVKENKRSIVRICGPGDLVGFGIWLSAYSSERYQLRCLEAGELHFMPKAVFDKLSLELPELNFLVISSLCKIIILKDERIAALENHSVKERVMSVLSSLARKFGVDTPQGRLIDLKIDRPSLAAMASTSPESFARALTELEDDNLVGRKRRKILIRRVLVRR